jgi:hypothetical protein
MISVLGLAMLGTPFLLLIMLFPTLLELKKPKDAGPRIIMPDFTVTIPVVKSPRSLMDIDEPNELDVTLKPFVNVILGNLPVLDV